MEGIVGENPTLYTSLEKCLNWRVNMTRLTNVLKSQILTKAVEKLGVKAEKLKIVEKQAKITESLRIRSLGGKAESDRVDKFIKATNKQIATMPEGVSCNVVISGYFLLTTTCAAHKTLLLNGVDNNLSYIETVKMGLEHIRKPIGKRVELTDTEISELDDLRSQFSALTEKEANLKSTVNGILNSVTTVKKLLLVWPEAKELLPKSSDKGTPNLPMIQTGELNKLLGLK